MIRFTKDDTTLVKGVAIILLILHHLLGGNPGVPMPVLGTPFAATLGAAGKVCVVLFMLLSGYGMLESAQIKDTFGYGFVLKRLKKLYFTYWSAWLLLFVWSWAQGKLPLTHLYLIGQDPKGVLYLLRDLFGFANFGALSTPTFNGAAWFMEAIVICYLLFPLLAPVFRKTHISIPVLCLLISYLPWVYYLRKNDPMMHTDRALFYIFPFLLGMFFSRCHVLDWVKQFSAKRRWLSAGASAVLLFAALVARQRICLPFDPFFAVAIILFVICALSHFKRPMPVNDLLMVYGRVEAELWLLHQEFLYLLAAIPFATVWGRAVFTVLFCGAVAAFFSQGKHYLTAGLRKKTGEAVK